MKLLEHFTIRTSNFIVAIMALCLAQPIVRAQLPTVINPPSRRALWAGGTVNFAVGVSGTGPFTYQWQLNGTNLPNNIITTVAGNGSFGYSGDGGVAINASLYEPFAVAVDASGNLFIGDTMNNRIRKVDTNGIITTVAGNGPSDPYGGSYSGDGGAATNASLNAPWDVAVDASGNLFIADTRSNNRIRKVDTDGIITTVAGKGGAGAYSGDGGAATNASLGIPFGVAVDYSGKLFIADYQNNRIRKVGTNGIITTIAGKGGAYTGDGGAATNAGLGFPSGVTADASGNLFIAIQSHGTIRKVDTNGIITTIAGNRLQGYSGDGGAATNASLNFPADAAVDSSGNLYAADVNNNRIRKVDTNGIITTVAGEGPSYPNPGSFSGDGGVATNASLYYPHSVAVDTYGNLFIADINNSRIRKVTNTQGPVLALNNVTAANEGNYQVVVTGPGGSVTSSVARLIVAASPLIYQIVSNPDDSVALNFLSQPGSTNVALCATNLSPPVFWQSLSTNLAGPDGNWQYTDTNAAGSQTRFYRSLVP